MDSAGLLSGVLVMSGLYDRVLSLVNEAPAAALEEYASMPKPSGGGTISVPGLDTRTGLPNFAARQIDGNGVASGAYRFTRADIERMTVLVPALGQVHEGDLVLGPGSGEGYELGIVVGKIEAIASRDGGDYDARVERAKIVVLSVNERVGHVFLSRWTEGLFTANPDSFQLRRLVRLKAAVQRANLGQGDRTEFDPIVAQGRTVAVDVDYVRKPVRE